MRNIGRLSIVFVIGVAAFLVAIARLNNPPFSACQQIPPSDQRFFAQFVQNPSVNLSRYDLRINENGRPVTKAKVCIRADMGGVGGMSGMGLNQVAAEVGPGLYNVPLRFPMGGAWQGTVVIEPQDQQAVAVPIQLDVAVQ